MTNLLWIIFGILNLCLTTFISGFYSSMCLILCLWDNNIEKLCLWIPLSFLVQFVVFPILYEFLNRKSSIFHFLSKLKNFNIAVKILLLAFLADLFSVLPFYLLDAKDLWLLKLCFCLGGLCASYLGIVVWLKLRKCVLYYFRKKINKICKWLDRRRYATLKNIIAAINLVSLAELVKIGFSSNGNENLCFLLFLIIPFALIELISVLSYAKKQKAQPFQRGVIFIISLLIFIYTQISILILFLVNLI